MKDITRRRAGSNAITEGFLLSQQALVNLDPTGIVTDGSGYVTSWTNSGTGGAAYSPNVVVGTLANSSVTTLNGHNAVNSTGGYGLETTAGQTIASPATVFAVARFSQASPSADNIAYDARSNVNARFILQSLEASSDKFSFFQGNAFITLTEAYDTSPHVFTSQANGDSTTKLTVSGVGSVTGDGGSDAWDFGSLFANLGGFSSMQGYIGQLIIFPRALTAPEILSVQTFLAAKFGL